MVEHLDREQVFTNRNRDKIFEHERRLFAEHQFTVTEWLRYRLTGEVPERVAQTMDRSLRAQMRSVQTSSRFKEPVIPEKGERSGASESADHQQRLEEDLLCEASSRLQQESGYRLQTLAEFDDWSSSFLDEIRQNLQKAPSDEMSQAVLDGAYWLQRSIPPAIEMELAEREEQLQDFRDQIELILVQLVQLLGVAGVTDQQQADFLKQSI